MLLDKLLYYGINAFSNNKKEFPSYIINGDKIDNKEDIANNFNSFFQNIGPTLSANIPQHKNITIKTFLKEKIAFSFEFTNRTQFVSYNGTNSRTLTITTGVPQGSILGPYNASSKFHAILFADDTNLTSTLCSFDVNIDNNCNSLQLSTNINKELKKHTNMVRNKQTVT